MRTGIHPSHTHSVSGVPDFRADSKPHFPQNESKPSCYAKPTQISQSDPSNQSLLFPSPQRSNPNFSQLKLRRNRTSQNLLSKSCVSKPIDQLKFACANESKSTILSTQSVLGVKANSSRVSEKRNTQRIKTRPHPPPRAPGQQFTDQLKFAYANESKPTPRSPTNTCVSSTKHIPLVYATHSTPEFQVTTLHSRTQAHDR